MLAYHGSHRRARPPKQSAAGDYGPGIYFASERADAERYGPFVYAAELRMERPFFGGADMSKDMARICRAYHIENEIVDAELAAWPQVVGLIKTLIDLGMASHAGLQKLIRNMGYDSIVVPNGVIEDHGDHDTVGDYLIVFDEDQIDGWELDAT